ncbi:ABC transporter ATP-binding protein [Chlamydiota bacterium]
MKNNDVVIRFENVSKQYFLGSSVGNIREALANEFKRIIRKPIEEKRQSIWALKDISFEVKKGDVLGLIGPNGAGKTTVLKILSRIVNPTKGLYEIKGKIGALIEVGAGFHPELTGRENIFLNGSIVGLKNAEIKKKFDEIVAFSELEEFIDTPVKRYSSGMYVRLGFSVAAHLDPDILLIDEILSVGDIAFREKSMRRMDQIRRSNKAIVFISHSLYQVESICNKALWIDHGEIMKSGKVNEVVNAYLNDQEKKMISTISKNEKVVETDNKYPVIIEKVELIDSEGIKNNEFAFGDGMTVRIFYKARQLIKRPLFNLRISCKSNQIAEASMLIDGYGPEGIEGKGIVECHFDSLPLTSGVYDILLFARNSEGIVDIIDVAIYARFRVTEEKLDNVPMEGPMALNHLRQGPPVYIPRTWSFRDINI